MRTKSHPRIDYVRSVSYTKRAPVPDIILFKEAGARMDTVLRLSSVPLVDRMVVRVAERLLTSTKNTCSSVCRAETTKNTQHQSQRRLIRLSLNQSLFAYLCTDCGAFDPTPKRWILHCCEYVNIYE